jgi:hypothetical protein
VSGGRRNQPRERNPRDAGGCIVFT